MNSQTAMSLDTAVQEVLGNLTGLDLTYDPQFDRYRAIARQINRALRANALEHEWSYYADMMSLGPAPENDRFIILDDDQRPRVIGDDAIRLCDTAGRPLRWAYFLPRDALHKYADRTGLWAAVTRNLVQFNRPFSTGEVGLDVQLPIMREPVMFELPSAPEEEVPQEVRDQLVDFQYPDVVVVRASYFYAMTDPVMQPRVQTLEAQFKDLMYQLIERDDSITDTPYQNDFFVPVQNSIYRESTYRPHPLADERR